MRNGLRHPARFAPTPFQGRQDAGRHTGEEIPAAGGETANALWTGPNPASITRRPYQALRGPAPR